MAKLQHSAVKFFICNSMTFHSGLQSHPEPPADPGQRVGAWRGEPMSGATRASPSDSIRGVAAHAPLGCVGVRGWDCRAMPTASESQSSRPGIPAQGASERRSRSGCSGGWVPCPVVFRLSLASQSHSKPIFGSQHCDRLPCGVQFSAKAAPGQLRVTESP